MRRPVRRFVCLVSVLLFIVQIILFNVEFLCIDTNNPTSDGCKPMRSDVKNRQRNSAWTKHNTSNYFGK